MASGYAVCEDPLSSDAVIVNTCCFIQEATEESLDVVFSLHDDIAASGRDVPLIVAGCMPARYREDLSSVLTEADAFVPCDEEGDIVLTVRKALSNTSPQRDFNDRRSVPHGISRNLVNTGASRYVKISDGCDRFCSYCAIPYIRGRYRSFTLSEINERVDFEIATGAREIVFIAQDTGKWGNDLQPCSDLADLLAHFASRYPQTWFRVLYTEPQGITDRLIDVVSTHSNICSYFDIPLQHVNASVLRSMNRSGSARDFLRLISRIRSRIPNVTLRTTFIAGFPGESEQQFEEVLRFIEDAELDYVGVFPYSPEEGTAAASFTDQIDDKIRISRAQQIRDLADSISSRIISERIGEDAQVIIEGIEEDGQLYGRTQAQAPEIDGVTYVDAGSIGDMVHVTISGTLFYEMEGSVIRNDS